MAGQHQQSFSAVQLLLFFIALVQLAQAQAGTITCTGFNGGNYTGNVRCPGSNACCGADATCLSNRLCRNTNTNELIRAPCRVYPFDDTCAQICLYDEATLGGKLPRVVVCDDGSLCCDNDAGCCTRGLGIFLDESGNRISSRATAATTSYPPNPTGGTARITLTPATSATSTTTISQTGATTSAPNSAQSPGAAQTGGGSGNGTTGSSASSDNSGVKAGLGVGITIGIVAIAAAVFFLLKKRKKAQTHATELDAEHSGVSQKPSSREQEWAPPLPPKERYGTQGGYSSYSNNLSAPRAPAELGSTGVTELDSGRRDQHRYELGS